MQLITNYSDLLTKIELIKEQIKLNELELAYWFGVKPDGTGIPLGGKGSFLYGANTSLMQADKKIDAINSLREQLEFYEKAKSRMDVLINNLEGLDYKIAYLKIAKSMTHKEIAQELDYSEQYIRRRWMELKSNKDATDGLVNV